MKKIRYYLLFMALLAITNGLQAQTFQEYITLFPTLTNDFTWTGKDLENARKTGKQIPENLRNFVSNSKYLADGYALGKLEMGGSYIVFMASPIREYNESNNTQIALTTKVYDSKGNRKDLSGVTTDILTWTGGNIATKGFVYNFQAKYDFKKKQLIIESKKEENETPTENKLHDYKLSGKGFNLSIKTSKF
jgi:hypothetical protein